MSRNYAKKNIKGYCMYYRSRRKTRSNVACQTVAECCLHDRSVRKALFDNGLSAYALCCSNTAPSSPFRFKVTSSASYMYPLEFFTSQFFFLNLESQSVKDEELMESEGNFKNEMILVLNHYLLCF